MSNAQCQYNIIVQCIKNWKKKNNTQI